MADEKKKVISLKEGIAAIRDWANNRFSLVGHKHTKDQITDFPDSMKNPNSLKISVNGDIKANYDGSADVSIDIPTGTGTTTAEITDEDANIMIGYLN